MSLPPQAPYQQPYAPVPPPQTPPQKGAGLAIASMVLGIIALLLCWIPVINNLAAVLAVVGLGLGIPALLRARRGASGGKGLAITGLVTSVLAIVLVIATQVFYASVLDEVERSLDQELNGAPAGAVAPELVEPLTGEAAAPVADVVPLGVPAQVGDYQVTVDAVQLDGNAAVAAANRFNEDPTGQYVIAQLTVTYTGARRARRVGTCPPSSTARTPASTATPTARPCSPTTRWRRRPSTRVARTPSSSAWTSRRRRSPAGSSPSSRR